MTKDLDQSRQAKLRFKHNELFGPGEEMRLNACVGKNGGTANFYRYSDGYFEAGRRLIKSLEEDSTEIDCLIYPIVFVYRHGIETSLKHLMNYLPLLCNDTCQVKLTHKLLDNWLKVRAYLSKLEVKADLLDSIEQKLKNMIEIDPNGENFRYPELKDGSAVLQDMSVINSRVFGKEISFVADFLDGCSYWVGHLVEATYEQEHLDSEAEAEALYEQQQLEMEAECESREAMEQYYD